jgi:tyrosine-protein kinase Etk/Wzc
MNTRSRPALTQAPEPAEQRTQLAPEQPGASLGDYLDALADGRWILTAAIGAALLLGGVYLLAATPVFESDVLVQVEQKGKGLLGQLDELPGFLPDRGGADAEIELLRSRSLLATVIDELDLTTLVRPRHFPLFGRAIAAWREAAAPSPPLLGLHSFAWGGERIQVTRLEVPRRLEDRKLSLVDVGGGAYELRLGDKMLLRGRVSEAAEAVVGGERVAIFVAELVSRPGTEYRLWKLPRTKVIRQLQERLTITEKGKKTGVVRIALAGPSPERVAATLDAIARTYLRQDVERKSAEAEKTLDFINAQLPVLKANVEAAEAALSAYRARQNKAVDLSLETKAILDLATDVERRATELTLHRAELKQRFTDSHPAVEALREKERSVEAERAAVNNRLKVLPEAELHSVRLLRDVKVANELYVLLLNKAQELKVLKSGTLGNVRIVDAALVPSEPVAPTPGAVITVALLLGLLGGVGAILARNAINITVVDPEQLERELGRSVYASVPHSDAQEARSRKPGAKAHATLLAAAEPGDLTVESLRSLRTSLQFALSEASNNVVVIGGPTQGIGKSFTVANLAHLLGELGRRVVVVDADLRKGRLHTSFGLDKGPGLAEVICGDATIDQALRKGTLPNVQVITAGAYPPNPSELLSSGRFEDVIQILSGRFDVVLIDSPPILAVTDAMLVARAAATFLLVLRSGQHRMREITMSVKRLRHSGIEPHALVLNDVRATGSGRSRYAYSYLYEYR